MKVTVMAGVRKGSKYPFVDPVWQGNKLKPGAVIVKDGTGSKTEVEIGTYRSRDSLHGPGIPKTSCTVLPKGPQLASDEAAYRMASAAGCIPFTPGLFLKAEALLLGSLRKQRPNVDKEYEEHRVTRLF